MVDLSIVVCNVYYRPGRIYPDVGGISWYPQDHGHAWNAWNGDYGSRDQSHNGMLTWTIGNSWR
jgi:hypothetical protein